MLYTIGSQPIYDESLAVGRPVSFVVEEKLVFKSIADAKRAIRLGIKDGGRRVLWPAIYEATAIKPDEEPEMLGDWVLTRRVWPPPRGGLLP
jgi:hypothetical protein